ncbi:MAG: hypothetical protein OSB19_00835 [Opitutaceae bacterium]|nr:hypothetical protein [Opitutaceae bacterium]
MKSRLRIKLLAFIGLALLTFFNSPAFAQRGGGGGGGGGRPGGQGAPDPTAPYINQLKLEGKTKKAFKKAFNNHNKAVQKWSASVQKFRKKNQKYVGKAPPAPEILEKIKSDKAELDAQLKANKAAYKDELATFLTPEQVKQVDVVAIRVVEQRKKAQARRAANQAKQSGGKKKR